MAVNATRVPSGDTTGEAYIASWPVRQRTSPVSASGTTYRSEAKSVSHVSCRWALVTTPEESPSQLTPVCWNGPGVRLRGVPVPSAATTWTWLGRSKIQSSPLSRDRKRSTLRGACHDASSAS
jgi:hypothetical protein